MSITRPGIIFIAIVLAGILFAGCNTLPPEADFAATPTTGQVPVEVQFTDYSSSDIGGWRWDFNSDGVVDSTLQNPQYTYIEAGTYTVSLTVSNSHGSDYETKIQYVQFDRPCTADFIADTTEVIGFKKIQFTDLSEGEVRSWAWDFNGDGIIDSTEQNPTYMYSRDGIYSVQLTITGPNCESTITKERYINVSGCDT